MSTDIINGIVITSYLDMNPRTIINESSLDDIIVMKLSITGMTMISLGFSTELPLNQIYYKLNGPLPIPESLDYEALVMLFTFDHIDENIDQISEIFALWLIIHTKNRDLIYANHIKIETVLKEEIVQLKNKDRLNEPEFIKKLISHLYQNITSNILPQPIIIDNSEKVIKKTIEYFTVDTNGQLIELSSIELISSINILIFVNYLNKSIFIIIMNGKVSQRVRYLASKAVSELNSKSLKSEFTIRNITDELEKSFLIEKILKINKELNRK